MKTKDIKKEIFWIVSKSTGLIDYLTVMHLKISVESSVTLLKYFSFPRISNFSNRSTRHVIIKTGFTGEKKEHIFYFSVEKSVSLKSAVHVYVLAHCLKWIQQL